MKQKKIEISLQEMIPIWFSTRVLDTAIKDDGGILPNSTALHQNYPNPFNPFTEISYNISRSGKVTLRVMDLLGREVIRLVDRAKTPGQCGITWYGRNRSGNLLPSGIYFVSLILNDVPVNSMKILMIK